MRIFVAGATGVLGRRAVRDLVAGGHEVTGLARSPEKASVLELLGATPARVGLFEPGPLAEAVAGHDVVCSLATAIPPVSGAWMPGAWKENDRIRTEGVANLVDAALAGGVGRFIQESITFGLADGGDRWLDEDSPLDVPVYARTALEAEASVRRYVEGSADRGGVGVVLRFAAFYSADSHTTRSTIGAVRRRIGPFAGRDGYFSTIHLDDAASAVVAALAAPSGSYLVGDDEPLTRGEHLGALAAALGVKPPVIPPRWAGRLAGSKGALLVRSQRVSNRKLRGATGWAPRYPSVREGWPAVVAELEPADASAPSQATGRG